MIFQISDFETRSLPALPRSYPRHFAFYVAHPIRCIQRFSISIVSLFLGALAFAQTGASDDNESIKKTALDYIEGWYEGDAARMERALHPELAKRSLEQDASGVETLRTLTAQEMIDATARGLGKSRDPGDRRIEVEAEHVYGTIANVTVHSAVYEEYLQLVRTTDGWKIVNTLWDWADNRKELR